MLGDIIGELKGKLTGFRVLSDECCQKIESSFQGIGKILDVDANDMATFWAKFKEDGNQYGEGQGILFTEEGNVTCTVYGIGKMKGNEAEWRGSVFFNTSSKKLEKLNNTVGVFEVNVDKEGNYHEKIWEWK